MLSSGVIKRIVTAENDSLPQNPILQILTIKKLQAAKGLDRYRVILSDGVHFYTSGMISTQLNEMVIEQSIDTLAVIQLLRYTCNIVQGTRKVIVILDMKVIKPASEVEGKLGSPQQMSDQISVHETLTKEMKNSGSENGTFQPRSNAAGTKTGGFYSGVMPAKTNMPQNKPHGGVVVHPISSLTPYQNRWTIRARVTRKAPIRTWSNSKGEGRLFSIDLLDESGEIKATGFNQAVDQFYELLETGKVYYITKGSLRSANKQFTSIKNDYEMYLNTDTVIELCTENVALPSANFNFINISDIEDTNKDALVDVIGVVKASQDCVQITTRSTNRQVSKRDITIVDRSETSINVTLWGEQAEKFDEHANANPIVALKGAKVSDFGGRSLSVLASSIFLVNPDIPEAHTLRGWYDSVGKETAMKILSGKVGGGMNSQHKTIGQMRAENLGMGDKADYFTTTCTVAFVRKENCLYKACPSSECNKKVVDEGGEYRCEKCNRTYPDFKYRLIMSSNIFDCTGNQWVTCFQEGAEAILGQTAENIGRLRDEDDQAYNEIFEEACFKMYNMKLRAKVETYNDESRFKVICVGATPVNLVTESKRLLDKIKEIESL